MIFPQGDNIDSWARLLVFGMLCDVFDVSDEGRGDKILSAISWMGGQRGFLGLHDNAGGALDM
jgi:hypothetical protein